MSSNKIIDIKLSKILGLKKGVIFRADPTIHEEKSKEIIMNVHNIVNENYKTIEDFMNNKPVNVSALHLKDTVQLDSLFDLADLKEENLIKNIEEFYSMNTSFIHQGTINIQCCLVENQNYLKFTTGNTDVLFIMKGKWLFVYVKSLKSFKIFNLENKHYSIFTIPNKRDKYEYILDLYGSLVVKLLLQFNRLSQTPKEVIHCKQKVIGKNKKNNRPISSNQYTINLSNNKLYDYGKNYQPKRKYERHTESWPVRGHWRTYKSGKKTWVQPGVRGDKTKTPKKQSYSI